MTSEDIIEMGTSVIDVDKLIVLVESRSVIYDISLAEHHNHDVVNQCWVEISEELNVPVSECKQKWNNLRSSYLRYVRESKKMPSGSGQKKKKWHLADAMHFLQKHTGPFRKMTSNLNIQPQAEGSENSDIQGEETQIYDTDTATKRPCTEDIIVDSPGPNENANFVPMKKKRKTAVELVAAPIAAYLKAATEQKKHSTNDKEEDATVSFLKSLVPDIKTLNSKRQRKFKSIVMKTLHDLIDEQEDENTGRTFRPVSYLSSSSVNSHSTSVNSLEGREEDWQFWHQQPFLQQHTTDNGE